MTHITRSPAQKPACKDLSRNGQGRAITPEAAYTPVSNRAGSRSTITRSPAQKPAHKDLEPEWLKPSHSGSRPLMLRLLTAPAHAQN
ncbi:alpha-galactosidase [Lacticaseibacillus zeae]|uniref:Alpha-galactosidase n=1 Tax=Lacticaseibacillus zeae TaxID=57037 RepID=A0A5R8LNI0_LACZE|nr:alpha-galactosidase [Lacticaseibacillus zeae]